MFKADMGFERDQKSSWEKTLTKHCETHLIQGVLCCRSQEDGYHNVALELSSSVR